MAPAFTSDVDVAVRYDTEGGVYESVRTTSGHLFARRLDGFGGPPVRFRPDGTWRLIRRWYLMQNHPVFEFADGDSIVAPPIVRMEVTPA